MEGGVRGGHNLLRGVRLAWSVTGARVGVGIGMGVAAGNGGWEGRNLTGR